jgi:hypothetical protein
MNKTFGGTASLLAALLVLFSAMLDVRLAVGLAVLALLALSIYEFTKSRRPQNR